MLSTAEVLLLAAEVPQLAAEAQLAVVVQVVVQVLVRVLGQVPAQVPLAAVVAEDTINGQQIFS
jgi:hypothetical protein